MSVAAGMLGMGITIHLRDLFTRSARQVGAASSALNRTLITNQKALSAANRQLAMGGGLMLGGGLMAGLLTLIAVKATKASSEMEQYQNQFTVLLKNNRALAQGLFTDVTRFAAETPFNIPEVVAGAKNLLAFGIAAKDVKNQLKLSGDWASIFNKSLEWTSTVVGRLATGSFGRIYPALRSMGIRVNELGQYGAPMTKDGIIQKGADPKKVLAALNKYIEEHFLGGMNAKMMTIPGRISNIEDKMILMMAKVGDATRNTIFGVVRGIEESLDPDRVAAFATAFGQGLNMVINAVKWLLTPLAYLVKSVINLSESHPGIVKFGVAMFGAAAGVFILSGAFIMLSAVMKLIRLSEAGKTWIAWKAQIMMFLPVLAVAAVLVFALVSAFKKGDRSVVDTLRYWYNNIRLIATGITELFSSINNGVGYLSSSTAKKLQDAGLLDTVKHMFMVGYRLYQVLAGAFQSFSGIMTVVGWVLGRVFWVISGGINIVTSLAVWLGLAGKATPTTAFKILGNVLGVVVAWLVLYKTYVMLSAGWSLIFTTLIPKLAGFLVTLAAGLRGFSIAAMFAKVSTWALNAALWANPIVWIIGLVVLLVAAIVLLVIHFDKVKKAAKVMPDWALMLYPGLGPIMLIIKYWDKLALTVKLTWSIIKQATKDGIDYMLFATKQAIDLMLMAIKKVVNIVPNWMTPVYLRGVKAAVNNLSGDQIIGKLKEKSDDMFKPRPGMTGSVLDKMNESLLAIQQYQSAVSVAGHAAINVPVYLDGRVITKVVAKRQQDDYDAGK